MIESNKVIFTLLFFLSVVISAPQNSYSQGRKIRISNATLSYSALPLVAAHEWKLFQEQGLDVEIILMRSAAAAAALVSRCREKSALEIYMVIVIHIPI